MNFKRLKTYGDLVMFRHTLFALPFAFVGVLLAARGLPAIWQLIWVLLAMIGARNGANALNRLVDREIDGKNPRTAHRHLPKGLVRKNEVLLLVIGGFTLFILSAYMLNPLCLLLLPVPLVLFIVYSYTKRFTFLCHLVLGAAVGGAPMGGWLAIRGVISWPDILPPFLLWAAVALWVAGFDILYATQDVEFDRTHHLHSIPVSFGISGALWISRSFHLLSVFLLIGVAYILHLGWWFGAGILIIFALLIWEHSMLSPTNLNRVKIASYHVNEVIGIVVLVFTLVDVLL